MKISFVGIISLLFVSFFVGCVVIVLPISLIPSLTQNTTARLLCKPGTFEVHRRTSAEDYECKKKEILDQL